MLPQLQARPVSGRIKLNVLLYNEESPKEDVKQRHLEELKHELGTYKTLYVNTQLTAEDLEKI